MLDWAVRQKKTVVENVKEGSTREVSYEEVFGELAEEEVKVPKLEQRIAQIYTYLVSFTTQEANKVVRNSGQGQGLEAWRRLHREYDPTSMRRVAVLKQVCNPPKCSKVEELGRALEDWLAKKRKYEEFTDRRGEPCIVSEDVLIAAMYQLMPKTLEETVMFKADDLETFEELYE